MRVILFVLLLAAGVAAQVPLDASNIPPLDASKITSGVFDPARIPPSSGGGTPYTYNPTTGSFAFGPNTASQGLGGRGNLWLGPDTGPIYAGGIAGDGNTAVGWKTLWNFGAGGGGVGIGHRNTVFGSESFQDFGYGGDSDATVVGFRVGYYVRSGGRDTMVGSNIAAQGTALYGATTGGDNTWLGYNVQTNFVWANDTGSTPYPARATIIGSGANGTDRTIVIGYAAGAMNSSTLERYGTGTEYTDSIVIGNFGRATGTNQFVIGSTLSPITDAYFGKGALSTSASSGVRINATGASGANNAGGPLTLAAGRSTGNRTPASIFFATSLPTTSGSALQPLVNQWEVTGTGKLKALTTDSKLIMRSPNGQCWEVSVMNSGTLTTVAVGC